MSHQSKVQGPARVLVVAREALAELVRLTLSHGLYTVETTADVALGEERKHTWHPHLLLVDIDLAHGNPEMLIGQIIRGLRIPSIVLTDRGDLKTKLLAFEAGADDFLTLPFSPEELIARAHALMRRAYGEGVPVVPVIRVAGLEIDLLDRNVRSGAGPIHLTDIEQALLYLLASNAGKTLARETILDALWGSDYTAESNLVDRHVRNLRMKLNDDWHRPRFIRTIPGKGYRFIASAA